MKNEQLVDLIENAKEQIQSIEMQILAMEAKKHSLELDLIDLERAKSLSSNK